MSSKKQQIIDVAEKAIAKAKAATNDQSALAAAFEGMMRDTARAYAEAEDDVSNAVDAATEHAGDPVWPSSPTTPSPDCVRDPACATTGFHASDECTGATVEPIGTSKMQMLCENGCTDANGERNAVAPGSRFCRAC